MAAAPKPPSTLLVGHFVEYEENGREGDIELARRLELPGGGVAFIAEHEDPDDGWELRVQSSDGRSFRGTLTSRDGGTRHAAAMTLWRAPDDEAEWLLLGTWTDEDGAEIPWSIHLHADEPD